MGVSAQQHRAASGCYAAKFWSSGWTPRASAKSRSKKKKSTDGRGQSADNPAKVTMSLLLLVLNILVTALVMVLVPTVTMAAASDILNGQSDQLRDTLICPCSVSVNPYIAKQLLILAGDVETNPGPETEESPLAKSMRLGLAKLLVGAPDKVHEVLSVWSSTKAGNEIVQVWANNTKKFKAADLHAAFAWLTGGVRKAEGKKAEVAEQLLVELETYLPDTCQVCQEEYTIERGSEPKVRCSGCHQGFHEPCLATVGIPDQGTLPWQIILLCTQCKPY